MKDDIPLVVDVDGSVLRTDLLWEGLVRLCVTRPARLPGLLAAFLRGRAAAKAFVAGEAALDLRSLPLEEAVMELVRDARTAGRPVVLASGAHRSQVDQLGRRIGADFVWGSDEGRNLTGEAKLRLLLERWASFDYVGNGRADYPLWREARKAFALKPSASVLRRARRERPDLVVLGERAGRWRLWLRALRLHQWAKNLLLFLPAIAAHLRPTPEVVLALATGFAAFSATASALYLVNDLADLPHDRRHPEKRRRPLAAGEISIPAALAAACGLLLAAGALAWSLPPAFQACLAAYAALTVAYSFLLKSRPVADVIALATLYTVRIVAGAALVAVPLSQWFLAFSVFFFLSLAVLKRVVELRGSGDADGSLPGRSYVAEDRAVLTGLGAGSAAASALVYCLYITGTEVTRLYDRPELLWIGLPILLYWQARMWLLAGRGRVHDDPVVFALRDRVSYISLAGFLVAVWLAS